MFPTPRTWTDSVQVLPKSFPGSRLYQLRLLNDALAIVSGGSKPSILTVTCNPNWPEVKAQLAPGQIMSDRPDVLCTVFHEYLSKLLKRPRAPFGTKNLIHVMEFQKAELHMFAYAPHDMTSPRVLPKLTISSQRVCQLKKKTRLCMTSYIRFIAPNCLVNGLCKTKYPNDLIERTFVDNRGYVQYQRNHPGLFLITPNFCCSYTHI